MSQELKPCEEMTDAELDAELRENGIDPEQLIQNVFQKVCVLAKEQSAKIAQLERTSAALLEALVEAQRLLHLCEFTHEADIAGAERIDAAIAEAESLEKKEL